MKASSQKWLDVMAAVMPDGALLVTYTQESWLSARTGFMMGFSFAVGAGMIKPLKGQPGLKEGVSYEPTGCTAFAMMPLPASLDSAQHTENKLSRVNNSSAPQKA